jgi:hypothetical protein
MEPFVSPIDGTVISDRRQYREHCKKHNVVPQAEFGTDTYKAAEEQRAKVFQGKLSASERLARRQELYELIVRAERNV